MFGKKRTPRRHPMAPSKPLDFEERGLIVLSEVVPTASTVEELREIFGW